MNMKLRREELAELVKSKPWITPFEKLIAMTDESRELLELHEVYEGPCFGNAAWTTLNVARESHLVVRARREGNRNIYVVKLGRHCEGEGVACIEGAWIEGDKAKIAYRGIAGAGVGALCRGLAEGVEEIEILEMGGGAKVGRSVITLPLKYKLCIGIDDTDTKEEGATWCLVNNIALEMEKGRLADYVSLTLTQLYKENPHKTSNCVSSGLVLAVEPHRLGDCLSYVERTLRERTLSPHTGIAYKTCVMVPQELRGFTERAKREMVSLEEARRVAFKARVALRPVTGERGCIGALAALGLIDEPDRAAM
jgi:methanogenesis imperfect marker protein 11